jgi:hypothetical protein
MKTFFFTAFIFACCCIGQSQCFTDSGLLKYPIYQNGIIYDWLPIKYKNILLKGNNEYLVSRLFISLDRGGLKNIERKILLQHRYYDSLKQIIFYGDFFSKKNLKQFRRILKAKNIRNISFINGEFEHMHESVINKIAEPKASLFNKLEYTIAQTKVESLTLYDYNILYIPDLFATTKIQTLNLLHSIHIDYLPINLNEFRETKTIIIDNKFNETALIQGLVLSYVNKHISVLTDTSDYLTNMNLYYSTLYSTSDEFSSVPCSLAPITFLSKIPKLVVSRDPKKIFVHTADTVQPVKIAEFGIDSFGILHGESIFYHFDGSLMQKREYDKGNPVNTWSTYDNLGNEVSSVTFYKNSQKETIKLSIKF